MPSKDEELETLYDLFDIAGGVYDEDFFMYLDEDEEHEVQCPDCNGKGQYLLFCHYHVCKKCKGNKTITLKRK